MTVKSTIERANIEIAAGRHWRAKEILASSLQTYGYSREIYYAYANLLLALGDDLEAGRFYLLSVDEPDAAQSRVMELFLARYRNDGWQLLRSRFPTSARALKLGDYPSVLRSCLERLGAPELLIPQQAISNQASKPFSWTLPVGCIVAIVALVTCTIIGAYTIVRWMATALQL